MALDFVRTTRQFHRGLLDPTHVVRLSVNINKIATLRNSRIPPSEQAEYAGVPSLGRAIEVCIAAGAPGITIHPREDQRHITAADIRTTAKHLAPLRDRVEFNIEGDPRSDLMAMVHEVRPHQLTLVPVRPGEVTSEAGWPSDTPHDRLDTIIAEAHSAGIRVSLFVEPQPDVIRWAADIGADRIELYTEPYAVEARRGPEHAERAMQPFREAAVLAHSLGLGINAGHDLDLHNLDLFRRLPHLDEVSIGHAIMAEAMFEGLGSVVSRYLSLLAAPL